MAEGDRPVDRRAFFRGLLRRGMDTLEEAGKNLGKQVIHSLEQAKVIEPAKPDYSMAYTPYAATYVRYLRPPGARSEWELSDVCSRCGKCVDACPADAIKLAPEKAGGLPHIVAREQPCVVCNDLSCMKVCPTGALQLVGDPKYIRMGMAIVDHHTCVRSDWREDRPAEDCTLCIDVCPFGDKAIGLDYHGMIEVRDGCTGCGLCESRCPTEPASIWVEEAYDAMHDRWHDHATEHVEPAPVQVRKPLGRGELKRLKRIRGRDSVLRGGVRKLGRKARGKPRR